MKKIKWFWVWDDEKEEAWLREMALGGFLLEAIYPPCIYIFKSIPPKDVCFRMDFWNQSGQGLEKYLQPRTEAGWAFISKLNGWHYFCKPAEDGKMPLFADIDQNKAQKFQRLMTFLVGFLPVMLLWFPIIDNRLSSPLYELLGAVFIISLLFFIFATYKIYRRINQLREL